MANQSRSEHILELARELLDDIELSRTSAESLVLKASRLARWVGSDEIRYWLRLEMSGYNSSDEISLKYMSITGRWINREKNLGYWGPLAQQEAAIAAEQAKLAALRTPDSSGEWASVAIANVTNAMTQTANNISTLSAIKSRVLAQLHSFVSEVYYEKEFDNLSESIFERYKSSVDTLIAESCGDILQKIPSVMSRLSEGDPESISQALTTCRRIIEAFADSIFPPTDETIEIGGNTLRLDASKHQNRINAYVHQRVASQSRKQKFRQNLSNLFDRISSGVHNDVTVEEANSLFLNTYLFLGEILHIRKDA
jgi:AbiTii-like protein